jgi:hypothetical protein
LVCPSATRVMAIPRTTSIKMSRCGGRGAASVATPFEAGEFTAWSKPKSPDTLSVGASREGRLDGVIDVELVDRVVNF